MTLLDIYEELFEYVCRLNRSSKAQTQPDYERVRSDVLDLLEKLVRKPGSDALLLNQVHHLELPIIFFIDNLICTSGLSLASQWAENRLAVKLKNELAGDERFFEFLDADLADPSEESRSRLTIYYTCLGLGFTGMYVNQRDKLNAYMNQIYSRIKPFMNSDPSSRLTGQAYNHTNTTLLTEPPSKWLTIVTIAFVFFAISALAVYYGLYIMASGQVRHDIQQTISSEGQFQ
jgi:type IV/VI secretion system ImpK/VasF family protein